MSVPVQVAIERSIVLIEEYDATPWWRLRTRARLRRQVLRLLMAIYIPPEAS